MERTEFEAMTQNKHYAIDGNRFHDRITVRNEFWTVFTTTVLEDTTKTINLDALNDILFGGFGTFHPEESIQVTWLHSEKSKIDLGYPETVAYLTEKLQYCHPENTQLVEAEISAAKAHTGPTLFDLLIEVINSNKHIQLVLE